MRKHRRRARGSVVADFNSEIHQSDKPFNAQLATDIIKNPNNVGPLMISVTRSIRNDPLAGMLSRRSIDRAQFEAGRMWQSCYETAGIGQIIAMDPLKEPVDGGGATRADVTDYQLDAFRNLKDAAVALGRAGDRLVHAVLGEGLSLLEIAIRNGYGGTRGALYVGARFRECLETLAEHWGLAGVEKTNKRKL